MWGADSTHVWAVGDAGTILFWNGTIWAAQVSGSSQALQGVHGVNATNVWAVGATKTILKWSGTAWTGQTGPTGNYDLNAIFAFNASNLWAVGPAGKIIKSTNGTSWAALTSGTTNDLYSVWASSATSVTTVGEAGTVRVSNDGSTWAAGPASGVTTILRSVTGTDASHVWIAGDSGVIRFYNGTGSFTAQTSGTGQALNGIFAASTTKVVAVGARMTFDVSSNGTSWTAQAASSPASNYTRIWASDDDHAWFIGPGGVAVLYNGTSFTATSTGVTQTLYGIWGADDSNVWAVGGNGTIIKWNGSAWAVQTSGSTAQLNGVHGASATDLWAVGNGGVILHYNGTAWAVQTSGVTVNLNSVWSSGPGVAWAVGANGTILKLTSGAWKAQTSGTTANLNQIAGLSASAIWAAGSTGTILKYNGTSWIADKSNTTIGLTAITVPNSANLWATGSTTIMKGTGTAWANDGSTGYPNAINAAFGTGASSVFLATTGGMIFVNSPTTIPEITIEQPAGTRIQSNKTVVNFGNVPTPTSATLTVTIKSTGTADLTGLALAKTGTGASYFTYTTPAVTSLTPGSSTTFDVTFTPPSDGVRTASIVITSNDLDEPLYTLLLSATGVVAPTFTTQPLAKIVNPGTAVTLTCAVSTLATKPVTYQWQRYDIGTSAWVDIATATAASYPISNIQEAQQGDYRVLAINAAAPTGVPSNSVNVSVNDPVVITSAPVSQTVGMGLPFTFSVAATGTSLKYQWRKNGTSISGATSSSYYVGSASLTHSGSYSVVVSNAVNSITTPVTASPANLTVVDGNAKTLILPTGGKAVITASYSGKLAAVSPFVWKKDGNPITDIRATFPSNVLTITPLQVAPTTDSATYTCEITTADGVKITNTTNLIVYSGPPVITGSDPLVLPDAYVDDPNYSYQIPYSSLDPMLDPQKLQMPTTFAVSGLPYGLTYNKTTGLITGKPVVSITADKLYSLTITVSNAKDKATRKANLTLKALPTAVIGSFSGPVNPDLVLNKNLGGRMDVTISSNGYYSGKVTLGGIYYSFSGYLLCDITHPKDCVASATIKRTAPLPNLTVTFTTDPDNFALKSCDVTDGTNHAAFSAWFKRWGTVMPLTDSETLKHYLGYYTYIMESPVPAVTAPTVPEELTPQGYSYGSFTVATTGALTAAGRLADGTSYTCSTFCGPTGQVLIYQALYTSAGSVLGTLDINEGTAGFLPPYGDNTLTGTVRWLRPTITTSTNHVYRSGFGPFDLTAKGGRYVAPTSPALLLGATETGLNNAALSFLDGGLKGTSTDPISTAYMPDLAGLRIKIGGYVTVPAHSTTIIPDPNPRSTTLGTIPTSTGLFSGTSTLVDFHQADVGTKITRTIYYYGIIYRDGTAMKGKGYFLLPRRPAISKQSVTATDQLSGKVMLDKL